MFGVVSRLISSSGKIGVRRIEVRAAAGGLGIDAVDGFDPQQAEELLVVLRRAHLAGDAVAGAQAEAANLRLRDVDVVRARQQARSRAGSR